MAKMKKGTEFVKGEICHFTVEISANKKFTHVKVAIEMAPFLKNKNTYQTLKMKANEYKKKIALSLLHTKTPSKIH